MNQWSFVIAAYAVTVLATLALLAWARSGMVRAERAADELKRPR